MRQKYWLIVGVVCFVSLGIVGCKSSKPLTPTTQLISLPDTFPISNGNANSSEINWKKYFADSTLHGLIDTALTKNLDLLMTFQRIASAQAYVKYTKGLSRPYISGSAATGMRKFGKYTADGVGNYDVQFSPNISKAEIVPKHLPDYYLGLQASWEIDIWGKLKNKRQAAVANYLGTIEGKNWVVTNLISEVASLYYELLALDIEIDIIRETIVLQNKQLSIIKLQKEAGRTNQLVVEQFEAQVLNYQGLEVEITQRIVETENRLNFLLGRYPQRIPRKKTNFTQKLPDPTTYGIPSELLKNRPDIKQAEYTLIASKANVESARKAFYPSFTINGSSGLQSFNLAYFLSPQSLAYSVFGGITAPLVNKSAIKAQFRNANAQQLEAMYNYQKSIINGYVDVYNQMVNIQNLEKIHQLKNEEVEILNDAIETSSELYLTGRANYIEIIITRKNALQSQLELVEVKQRQYNAIINIYKALGGGWR